LDITNRDNIRDARQQRRKEQRRKADLDEIVKDMMEEFANSPETFRRSTYIDRMWATNNGQAALNFGEIMGKIQAGFAPDNQWGLQQAISDVVANPDMSAEAMARYMTTEVSEPYRLSYDNWRELTTFASWQKTYKSQVYDEMKPMVERYMADIAAHFVGSADSLNLRQSTNPRSKPAQDAQNLARSHYIAQLQPGGTLENATLGEMIEWWVEEVPRVIKLADRWGMSVDDRPEGYNILKAYSWRDIPGLTLAEVEADRTTLLTTKDYGLSNELLQKYTMEYGIEDIKIIEKIILGVEFLEPPEPQEVPTGTAEGEEPDEGADQAALQFSEEAKAIYEFVVGNTKNFVDFELWLADKNWQGTVGLMALAQKYRLTRGQD
jgi:hypothetical protein